MGYNYLNEIEEVKKHYAGDPLQKRFSLLLTGETNAGKTYLLRSARKPIHIDSFDPGGTKCLKDMIDAGDVIADTRFETEDPFKPGAFANWMKTVDRRIMIKYFENFGTYCLDSATTFGEAIMNYQLASVSREGEAPRRNKDYMPQKVHMTNYIKKLMSLPCDFILTGHLREIEELISIDSSTGIQRKNIKYRFYTVGQAVVTIPLLFDEIYVLTGRGNPPVRELLTDSLGVYIARSRLKRNGLLDAKEPPNIKALLKKAGYSTEDKPKIVLENKDV